MNDFKERDPDEVRRELRWRRAAATVLFHRLDGNPEGEAAGMQQVDRECQAYGVTPSQVIAESVMALVAWYVRDTARDWLKNDLRHEMALYYGISGPDRPGEAP